MINEKLTYSIRGAAFAVHRALGPGLLESAYEKCLLLELRNRGYSVKSQVTLPFTYGEVTIDPGYRIDIMVEDQVILELKAVDELHPIHSAQLLTYLKLANKRVGLLMNFNVLNMQQGIKRFVL